VPVEPLLDGVGHGEQPDREVGVHRGADDTDLDTGDLAADRPVDDGDPTPGQAGVNTQHAHVFGCREHQFEL
jgi:hypothetical protein